MTFPDKGKPIRVEPIEVPRPDPVPAPEPTPAPEPEPVEPEKVPA
jgi:hypothetical protein